MLVTAVTDAWDQAVSVKKEEKGVDFASVEIRSHGAALRGWIGGADHWVGSLHVLDNEASSLLTCCYDETEPKVQTFRSTDEAGRERQ